MIFDEQTNESLKALGWRDENETAFRDLGAPELFPARVAGLHRNHRLNLLTADGELDGTPAGRLLHNAASNTEMPAVGDWVAADETGTVHHILPRRTTLSRPAPSDDYRIQVLAANVDVVIAVSSLNRDHNTERLGRIVALTTASGARSVVALSKSDLLEDTEPIRAEVAEALGPDSTVIAISSRTGEGLDLLRESLVPGETVVMIGSSGVGKSTLANTLLGWDRQKTIEIRERDDRGRHATTSRELFPIPGGALLIDTPGLRAPGLLIEEDTGEMTAEFAELAAQCKFRDCRHEGEPGCAVAAAREKGLV